MPKNTTQCLQPGLERGQLTPELNALTMRQPCFPQSNCLPTNLPHLAKNLLLSICSSKQRQNAAFEAVKSQLEVTDLLPNHSSCLHCRHYKKQAPWFKHPCCDLAVAVPDRGLSSVPQVSNQFGYSRYFHYK